MSDDTIQGSDAWKKIRCGKVTASRVSDVIAKTKSGPSASRANYMAQLICERLTGAPSESFTNAAMIHGTETEPDARAAYEFYRGVEVEEISFCAHPTIDNAGCSPDGLVGNDGLIEIKCPQSATHLDTLLSQTVPAKYVTQMLWQMEVTGRKWCDFVSFDPRLPESMSMFVKRVERDDKRIAELRSAVIEFLDEVEQKLIALNRMYGAREAA